MPTTLNAVTIVIFFIIPGFITDSVISLTIPRSKRESTEIILSAITFSCVNYALFSWLILLIYLKQITCLQLIIPSGVIILLIGPILEGFVYNWFANSDVFIKILKKCKLKNIKLIPKAWDYFFAKEKSCWILVTLKNGTKIGGFWGINSFASSFPAEEDVYIEEMWKIDQFGKFCKPILNSEGCLIRRTNIKHIEFFSLKKRR